MSDTPVISTKPDPEAVKAAAVSEVGQKSYRAVNKLLDEYLAEKK